MRYDIKHCLLKIEDKIYHFNCNYYHPIQKELSFIIKNNLQTPLYLHDIVIKKNSIVSAKQSTPSVGKLVEIIELTLNNNYQKSTIIITPDKIGNYNVKHLNTPNSPLQRNFYNKFLFEEIPFLLEDNFPLYVTTNNFGVIIENIFSNPINVYLKKALKVNKKEEIYQQNFHSYYKNLILYIDERIAQKYIFYTHTTYIIKLNKALFEFKLYLKQFNCIKKVSNKRINIIIQPEEKEYYVCICGLKMDIENHYVTTLDTKIGIEKIKIEKNGFKLLSNNVFYPLPFLDNNNITIHDTKEEAIFMLSLKISYLKKHISYLEGIINGIK